MRSQPRGSHYRPHLDGIRAVAVVLVILFHLGYAWVPGGFVGVDVFFVLSGYLITGLLLDEATGSGGLRLGRFYARRIRRLLPASALVLVVVMVTGGLLFDAVQRSQLGHDVTAAALYSANWRFVFTGGDYFAPGDVPSPVVHFWSLAVEEQFYLLWPAMFLGVWRLATRRRGTTGEGADAPTGVLLAVIAVLGVASAVASVVLVPSSAAYYGTHTRAYQLLAGGALAVAVRHRPWRLPGSASGRRVGAGLAVAALAGLVALAHWVPDARSYPGWAAIAVVVATVALIVGVDLGPPNRATRLLGHDAMAGVGRASYSLYIWHWPVIVFLPVIADRHGRPWIGDRPAMVLVTVAFAAASYYLVEQPVRFRLVRGAAPKVVIAAGLTLSVVVGVVGIPFLLPDGAFGRKALAAVTDLAKPGECPYFAEDWPAPSASEPCLYRQGGSGRVVAYVGDSHAQQWQPALEVLAERHDLTLVRVTRGGCPANDVTAYARDEQGRNVADTDCVAWRDRTYRLLVEQYDPDVIVVATRSHVRGIRADGRDVLPSDPAHLGLWAGGWDATLRTLSSGGATVVVSRILPTMPQRIPACLASVGERTSTCDFPVSGDRKVVPYNDALADEISGLEGTAGPVSLVDPTPIACPDGVCPAMAGDIIVHRDDNHLSATFVRSRADEFAALLAEVGAEL